MSKGGGSQTSTQKTEIPAYVQEAQQNTLATAQRFTDPFLQNPPATTVAGFTPDQNTGFELARRMAQNTFGAQPQTAPYNPIPIQNGHPFVETTWEQAATPEAVAAQQYNAASSGTPWTVMPTSAGAAEIGTMPTPIDSERWTAANSGPANLMSAATADPRSGQVGGTNIRELLNPYTQDVLDPTIARMRRELGQTQAQIGARNASAASFGGSRAALQSAEANRAFGDQVALTTGQLMAQGYDRATATALANAQNLQQAGEFNVSQLNDAGRSNQAAQNAVAEANAQRLQQANSGNAVAENAMRQFNTSTGQQASQFNAGQLNQRGEFNANLQDEAQRLNQAAINAAAEANAARQQQANAGNAAAVNNMGQFNANMLSDIAKFNTQERQGAQQFNSGQENDAIKYFAGLANQGNQFNANQALTSAGLQDTFANDEARRQATALQQLLGTGATQQANDQSVISQPLDMLRLLQQSTPGNIGTSTTTTQPTQSNPIGTLAGLATIARLFMG